VDGASCDSNASVYAARDTGLERIVDGIFSDGAGAERWRSKEVGVVSWCGVNAVSQAKRMRGSDSIRSA